MINRETLAEFARKLRESPQIVVQAVLDVLNEPSVQNYITFLIQNQLGTYQVAADGSAMPTYSPGYKRRYRKSTERYDLYLTGALYEGMGVEINGTMVDINSDVWYSQYYEYGIGLTSESMGRLRSYIREPLMEALINRLSE